MKEIELTEDDLKNVKDMAVKEFNSRGLTKGNREYFLAICYLSAFLTYFNSKGYVVIDGKLYEKEKGGPGI